MAGAGQSRGSVKGPVPPAADADVTQMTDIAKDRPVFMLVDEHLHSARLLRRILRKLDIPAQLIWLGDGPRALRRLKTIFRQTPHLAPDLLIVDLKQRTGATEAFLDDVAHMARESGIPIAALAPSLDPDLRHSLIAAGAVGVFERHHDLRAYRREISELALFWVRETGTWTIRD